MGLLSMTSFGRCEDSCTTGNYKVEIKTVNNRYIDVQFRTPRIFAPLEQKIKKLLTEKLIRGSVWFSIVWDAPEDEMVVAYDSALAGKYAAILSGISEEFSLASKPTISDLAPFYKEIISQKLNEFTEEQLWNDLKPVVVAAIDRAIEERVREGDYTKNELVSVLDGIEENLELVKTNAPARLDRYKERLKKAVADLKGEGVEESRIAFETALMAEKLDIAEEATRLGAHIVGMRELLATGGAVGKKMGFLLQEMNRECNTIGSKANDSILSAIVVDLKEQVEQIREQSLNLV
jgi:uncharacterized protein (TIGR00255 family)